MAIESNGHSDPEKGKPVTQDASDSSSQSISTKNSPAVVKSPFTIPTALPSKTKSSDSNKKPESTFIKVDYMKSTKTEKTKESVARVLSFAAETPEKMICSEEKATPEKESPAVVAEKELVIKKDEKPEIEVKAELKPVAEIKVEKESSVDDKKKISIPVKEFPVTPVKSEIKKEPESSSKHPSSSSRSTSHHNSSHHKNRSSSSHHKSSSSSSYKHRHSSSSKDCSRCYRRSKIKKTNIGIQVRPSDDPPKPPTRSLEFEASHRVGVNRQPVAIDTNLSYLKYGRFYHIEVHPNGGASIVHMYQDELDSLSKEQMTELVDEFFNLVFSEDENGFAFHVMGVVHDGARYLPDLLEHMAENYSNLTVKSGVLGRNNDIETCTMMQYYDQVLKNYDEGTVRAGPLHQISLVGKVHEEVGGYFPDLLGKLEQSPFLKKAMPWGKLSIVQMDPRLSNDGPILWIRPGEQLIPTAEMAKTPLKRQRARINELRNLQYLPRASEAREIMFEDRTKAHADHVGMGHERQTTAAVG